MPSNTLGWNRGEIVSKVLDTIGRTGDATLQTRLREDINFAQLNFWKLFDWKFDRTSASAFGTPYFELVDNTIGYILDTTTTNGYEIRATDIDKIYILEPNDADLNKKYSRSLKKVELREIRNADPGATQYGVPEVWAVAYHNAIEIWPYPNTAQGTPAEVIGLKLHIDAKVMPQFMDDDADYPDIPIEYQEAFIEYLTILAYKRENDPRWKDMLVDFENLAKKDKQADLAEVESNLRMKWAEEELGGSQVNDPEAVAWSRMFNS
jgi:hypothetical protein